MVLVEGKRSQARPMSGYRLENNGENPEISVAIVVRRNHKGVGEIPLN